MVYREIGKKLTELEELLLEQGLAENEASEFIDRLEEEIEDLLDRSEEEPSEEDIQE